MVLASSLVDAFTKYAAYSLSNYVLSVVIYICPQIYHQ
jgi:hypothetical protein